MYSRRKMDPKTRLCALKKPSLTLADPLKASMFAPDFVNNFEQFEMLSIDITITPNPCWTKVLVIVTPLDYNYQHDLESIWRIILWIILSSRIQPEEPSRTRPLPVHDYFDRDISAFEGRMLLFTDGLQEIRHLFPPSLSKYVWKTLETLRQSMHIAYVTRALFGHLDIAESYSDIQVRFVRVLRAIPDRPGSWNKVRLLKKRPQKYLEEPPLVLLRSLTSLQARRKRGRDSGDYVDGTNQADDTRPVKNQKKE